MENNPLEEFFGKLDRAQFVDPAYKQYAHADEALPIGFEQTISQPTLVYRMTQMLALDKKNRVLEIGTGSGYQTAFLAEFAGEVYTVERVRELSWKAVERLLRMGYENVSFKIGDGSEGWPDFAPYDRILVTAAAGKIPDTLVEQLKPGGKMIIPVGEKGLQKLLLITKDERGALAYSSLGDVRFVEFQGEYGWRN